MIEKLLRKVLTILRWKTMRLRGLYVCYLIRLMGGVCHGPIYVDRGFLYKYPPHSGWQFGRNIFFGRNIAIDVPLGGALHIGDNVKFNMDIVVAASSGISIGAHTQIAEFVSIRDSDHGIALGELIVEQPLTYEAVSIGCDVWLARGVAVLKGSIIKDGAVIGANAVVRGLIPRNAIAVGIPARVIKERTLPNAVGACHTK